MAKNGDKTQRQMIVETHATMIELRTVILGVENSDDKGLVGDVKNHDKRITNVSRRTWMFLGGLIAISALLVSGTLIRCFTGF